MPRVQRYGTPKVGTTALPRARRTAANTAETLGAGVERARGQRGETIGAVGNMIARVGVQAYEQIQERERKRADEIAVLAAENSYAEFGQGELSSVLALKGNDAFAAPEAFDKKISEFGTNVRKTLSTDRQRAVFDQIFSQRRLGWKLTVERHVAGEIERFHTSEFIKGIENDQREAVAFGGVGDLHKANESLTRAVLRVKEHGEYLGMGPEAVKAEVLRVQSGTHAGIIDNLLANDNDRGALAYFEEANAEGQLQGDIVASLKTKLDAASTAGEALRASDDLWTRLGPKGETDAINLDTMESAARERFADDPKTLTATIQRLRERKAGVDAGRRERQEASAGKVWSAVAAGASLADVQKMPEYLGAGGQLQAQVSNFVVDQAEQAATRAYMRLQRADATLSRADAAAARAENLKERGGWAAMWEYSSPAKLTKMSEDQILGLMPEIGIDHVNRLMEKKRALAKSDDTVRAASIDEDLFKTTARDAGLDAYTPKTDEARADLGRLRNAVEDAIDQEQRATGKILTRERKAEITRGLIDQKVMIDVWMGPDQAKVAAMVVNASDRATAYVPIESIPARELKAWINVIRSMAPSAQRMTDDQIRVSYKDRIQRAHAADVLGMGIDEQQRRLQGQ